jgi:hypothetical protein
MISGAEWRGGAEPLGDGLTRREWLAGSGLLALGWAARVDAAATPADAAGAHAFVVSLDYQRTNNPLANTHNDGRLIASRLSQLKFGSVDHVEDPDEPVFAQRLQAFMARLRPGNLAFVYYAGHGVQIGGVNYLLMADGLTFISMQSVIETLRGATDTIVLLLDACRTRLAGAEPLEGGRAGRGITSAEVQRVAGGSGPGGVTFVMKKLEPGAAVSRLGTFELRGTGIKIVFATDPQNVAADSVSIVDMNSPFASAVGRRLLERRSLDDVIAMATGDVVAATEGAQSPWSQGSIGRPIFLAGPPLNRNPAKPPFQVPG